MGLFDGFLDDAAVFPPGSLPLAEAVVAHLSHRSAAHAGLVGPFVVASSALGALAGEVSELPAGSFEVALTVPKPGAIGVALAVAERIPAVVVRAVEVAAPADVPVAAVVPTLDAAFGLGSGLDAANDPPHHDGIEVFVELPRDERRGELVAALSHTAYLAKLRSGGVRADLYPGEDELTSAIVALTRVGLPFKATAGLHHAVRNTDTATGFEQHGFLNVMAAVAAALDGSHAEQVAALLAERDGRVLAGRVARLADRAGEVRALFRSIGTCSIDEPVTELADLGLLTTRQGAAVA